MSKVLIVGAGQRRSHLIDQGLEGAAVHIVRKQWLTFLHARRSTSLALVIYDLSGVDAPKTDVLLHLPETMPGTGVLYLAGTNTSDIESLHNALQRPNVDFILDTDNPRELRLRANRLLAQGEGRKNTPQNADSAALPPLHPALRHTTPRLHASNGRLDAREVSALYGVSLAALARSLGRSEQSVHKTPTSLALQPALSLYERIASLLLRLTGSETGLRTWMQASNPELENEMPMTLLLNGEGRVIAELLEAVACGEPS